MKNQSEDRTRLLRKTLMGNALFSTVSGLTILFAQRFVLGILGISNDVNLAILGVALIIFAATLMINARKHNLKTTDAWMVVGMDVAWVVGSCVLVFTVPFSTGGKWLVAGVAELVLLFAILQFVGLRRIQKAGQPA